MTRNQTIATIIVLVLLTALFLYAIAVNQSAPGSPNPNTEANTTPASSLPSSGNDSSVSGSGATSSGNTASSSPNTLGNYTLRIGQSATVAGIRASVLSLVEDSRCPIGVQCIQAGTVRVSVKVEKDNLSATTTMRLNEPVTAGGFRVELVGVTPDKRAGQTIAIGDYQFIFRVQSL